MSKITVATVKSFIRKNRTNLLVNQTSDFDGMVDCVRPCDTGFLPANDAFNPCSNNLNIGGVWFVGGSRDYCSAYDNGGVKGFRVFNCCGSFIVGVPD